MVEPDYGCHLQRALPEANPPKSQAQRAAGTTGGKAVVITMSIASLSTNNVPTLSDVATTKAYLDYNSA